MKVRLLEASLHSRACKTRLPFRFGIHTMTAAPLCLLRVLVERDAGGRGAGFASDLLVPRWFVKNPDQPVQQDWRDLLAGARAAVAAALSHRECLSVFEHWRRLDERRVREAPAGPDRLLRGHGVSLVERALIDAVCRLAGASFVEALHDDLLELRPGAVDRRLRQWRVAPPAPAPSSIAVRHTVGLADALRPGDVTPEGRVNDGLPECLEADIRRYGLDHFKLKLSGDIEHDLDRVQRIVAVLRAETRGRRPVITLDGNEQFATIAAVIGLLERFAAVEPGRWLLDHLELIEQPLPRADTLDAVANTGLETLSRFAPCLIDEADADVDAFPRAVAAGYRGVSVKNCKGVFRAFVNAGRCRLGPGLFQSAEDLTNLPVIALQQDLATVAALGIGHVERNGHHYFDGLAHLPEAEAEAALRAHGDLYEPAPRGPQLRIESGRMSLRSVLAAPGYGYDVPVDLAQWPPA